MRIIFIIVVFLCIPSVSYGQWFGPWGYSPHIDPRANRIDAFGHAIKNKAKAEDIYQNAAQKYLKNNQSRIDQLSYNRDTYRQRKLNSIDYKNETQLRYLKAKQARLENLKLARQLKIEEENMRMDGILPPKPDSYIGVMGKRYKSWAEFKNSPEYSKFKQEVSGRLRNERNEEWLNEQYVKLMIDRSYARTPQYLADENVNALENIQKRIDNDMWNKVFIKNEDIPFSEWPESWKQEWKNRH